MAKRAVLSKAAGKFRVTDDGNLDRINGVSYTWPGAAPGANTFLKHTSGGNLAWEAGGSGGGDMYKSVYDTDGDNIVDKAEMVDDGMGNSSSAVEIKDAVNKRHANTNDPTAGQKAALAGTDGAPSDANRYVTNSDPRNTNARAPTAHGSAAHTGTIGTWAQIDKTTSSIADITTRSAGDLTSGTLDGDRLPTMSATKRGGVPPTGTPANKYLRDDATWQTIVPGDNISVNGVAVTDADFDDSTPAPPANAINVKWQRSTATPNDISAYTPYAAPLTVSGGNLTVVDAAAATKGVIQLAGQLGGTAASPDVRGLRETGGPTLLTLGAIADGQYLMRSGTNLIGGSPGGGGSNPPWWGVVAATFGNSDPAVVLARMLHNPLHATPTDISTSVARCSYFRPPANIAVTTIRWFGVGATSGIYRVAVYRVSDGVRMALLENLNTSAQTWGAGAFSCSLAAGVLYLVAVAVNATGTTAGIACHSGSTGRIGVIPESWPGSLDIDIATPRIDPVGYVQFAVTSGALPTTLPARVAQAAWTGGMPAFFLDSV